MLPADSHVHTEWSWDAARGSMEESCWRAEELGLEALAFTEHADFTPWRRQEDGESHGWGERRVAAHLSGGALDIAGYWECLEACRERFPGLRILSGVELGEPHRFVGEAAAILDFRPLDRVLGSVHCVPQGQDLVDASTPGFLEGPEAAERCRTYFSETLALVESAPRFAILAHLTYPQRYWPSGGATWSAALFEEEIRSILAAAAAAGLALELNTTRGMDPARGLCPPAEVLGWWRRADGRAVSLGSDAHDPLALAAGFGVAAGLIEAAGFRRDAGQPGLWVR